MRVEELEKVYPVVYIYGDNSYPQLDEEVLGKTLGLHFADTLNKH